MAKNTVLVSAKKGWGLKKLLETINQVVATAGT
jgi:50S ribosomal subunit-associated GTPase HflX